MQIRGLNENRCPLCPCARVSVYVQQSPRFPYRFPRSRFCINAHKRPVSFVVVGAKRIYSRFEQSARISVIRIPWAWKGGGCGAGAESSYVLFQNCWGARSLQYRRSSLDILSPSTFLLAARKSARDKNKVPGVMDASNRRTVYDSYFLVCYGETVHDIGPRETLAILFPFLELYYDVFLWSLL